MEPHGETWRQTDTALLELQACPKQGPPFGKVGTRVYDVLQAVWGNDSGQKKGEWDKVVAMTPVSLQDKFNGSGPDSATGQWWEIEHFLQPF